MTEPIYGEYLIRPKVAEQVALVRKEIPLYQPELVGLQISNGTALVDPTTIVASVYKRDENTQPDNPLGLLALTFLPESLTKEDVGVYSFTIPNYVTQNNGQVNVVWEYEVAGHSFTHKDYYEVSEEMPHFAALTLGERQVVESVQIRFADLYDSMEGGPHLKEEFQTHFSKERIASLLSVAANTLNYQSQPLTNFFVGPSRSGRRFPSKSYGILEWALYLEVIRHLIRSYTEQPAVSGSLGVAALDRRDYTNRWREVLRDEEDRFGKAVGLYKRDMMNFGGGQLLVSGGLFGRGSAWTPANGMYTAALRGLGRNMFPISFAVPTGF